MRKMLQLLKKRIEQISHDSHFPLKGRLSPLASSPGLAAVVNVIADNSAIAADADGVESAVHTDVITCKSVCHRFDARCETFVRIFVSILREERFENR